MPKYGVFFHKMIEDGDPDIEGPDSSSQEFFSIDSIELLEE